MWCGGDDGEEERMRPKHLLVSLFCFDRQDMDPFIYDLGQFHQYVDAMSDLGQYYDIPLPLYGLRVPDILFLSSSSSSLSSPQSSSSSAAGGSGTAIMMPQSSSFVIPPGVLNSTRPSLGLRFQSPGAHLKKIDLTLMEVCKSLVMSVGKITRITIVEQYQ